jgi:glycosyltransferase involved in cell wall biosynthesis
MSDPLPTVPVSVVVPAYNRAGAIGAAIASVLRQSFADFELIVVDDGSTDGTRAAVAAIADPRLRLIGNPRNLGPAATRNAGIRAARGTWVAFQDSDDEWLPLKLEKQMARLTAPGAGFVAAYCGMLVIGRPDGRDGARPTIGYVPDPTVTPVEGDILRSLLTTSLVSTQTLVARRDHLMAIGGFDERLRTLEDWDCALRLAQLGPIACIDEPLVLQRFSADSLTRDPAPWVRSRAAILEKHADLYARHPAALARVHAINAGGHARLGNFAEARAALRKARAARPLAPRLWAQTGYLALRSLIRP